MSTEQDGVAGPARPRGAWPLHPRHWPFWLLAGLVGAFSVGFLAGLARPHPPRPR